MATLTRADWGAGPHRAGTIRTPVSRLFLHHTVTPFWVGAQAARNVQAIARSRGFLDISYSWLTDRQGNEIEGRGWGRQGAHTRGYNSTSHAVSLIGNLEASPLPAGMIRGAVRLVRRHARYGPRITHGHRDVAQTACPGRHAYARIAAINAATSGTPTPPQEDDMSFTAEDRQMLRELHLGRNHKRYGRDWIRDNVIPILEQIRDSGLSEPKLTQLNWVIQNGIRDAIAPPDGHAYDKLAAAFNRILDERGEVIHVDVDEIASAIVEVLSVEHARQVVDALVARLGGER